MKKYTFIISYYIISLITVALSFFFPAPTILVITSVIVYGIFTLKIVIPFCEYLDRKANGYVRYWTVCWRLNNVVKFSYIMTVARDAKGEIVELIKENMKESDKYEIMVISEITHQEYQKLSNNE